MVSYSNIQIHLTSPILNNYLIKQHFVKHSRKRIKFKRINKSYLFKPIKQFRTQNLFK